MRSYVKDANKNTMKNNKSSRVVQYEQTGYRGENVK